MWKNQVITEPPDHAAPLCVNVGIRSVALDKIATRTDIVAHEHGENIVCVCRILDGHLLEQTCLRVHRGFPKLLGIHLAQTFVTLRRYAILRTVTVPFDKTLTVGIGVAVFLDLALLTPIKRWRGDIQVTVLNNLGHVTIEKRHDERVDVRAIDVGVGHDDNLVVAKFFDVGLFAVLAQAETYAKRLNNVVDFIAFKRFVPHSLLYVQYLAAQGQDGLRGPATALLGRTAGRITLYEEKLAAGRVLFGAVSQFTRQSASRHGTLALYAFAGLTSGDACGGSKYYLVDYQFGLLRMFLQIIGQRFTDRLIDSAGHLAVA